MTWSEQKLFFPSTYILEQVASLIRDKIDPKVHANRWIAFCRQSSHYQLLRLTASASFNLLRVVSEKNTQVQKYIKPHRGAGRRFLRWCRCACLRLGANSICQLQVLVDAAIVEIV